MSGGDVAEAAGSSGGLPSSSLPWHQIPKFEPGITDVRTYARKLEFLRDLWPTEHIEHLAPRAALMVEGVAFQKVARLQTSKLKTRDGVQYLVESLGGQWGHLEEEARYDLFEKALYTTVQRPDETNDSYLNRHDISFEELITKNVKLEEIRAYVMIRQSALPPDDRKKIIMDCQGKLVYRDARKSIKLLGSKFFQDLQGSGKSSSRTKTYDVNYTEEPEDMASFVAQDMEVDEDILIQSLVDEGDEDAHFIQDFEEQILLTCQDSPELSSCFVTYQEARERLKEKARGRGFWPIRPGVNAKGKGKHGGKKSKGGGNMMMKRRSLAERIANSTCRKCGQPGHWRRECPLNNSPDKDKGVFTGLSMEEPEMLEETYVDVMNHLPEDAEIYEQDGTSGLHGVQCMYKTVNQIFKNISQGFQVLKSRLESACNMTQQESHSCFMTSDYLKSHDAHHLKASNFSTCLATRLSECCRKHFNLPRDASAAPATTAVTAKHVGNGAVSQEEDSFSVAACLFNNEEAAGEAIIDTGASRAVIGEERVPGLLESLPKDLRDLVYRARTPGVTFKFGNSSKLTSRFAILLPRRQNGWLRVEVVPGQTPFLISNPILKGLKGIIDVDEQMLHFKGHEGGIQLHPCRKNLLGVNVAELLTKSPPTKVGQGMENETIMHVENTKEQQQYQDHEVRETNGVTRPQMPCHAKNPNHPVLVNENVQKGIERQSRIMNQGLHVTFQTPSENPQCNQQDHFSDQDLTANSNVPAHHVRSPWPKVSGTGTSSSRRSLAHLSGVPERADRDHEASGDQQSPGVGTTQGTSRETSRKDLRSDLCGGSQLRLSDEEPERCVILGEKFSDVQPGTNRSSSSGDNHWQSDAAATAKSIQDIIVDAQFSERVDHSEQHGASVQDSRTYEDREQEIDRRDQDIHDGGTRSPEGAGASDQDCALATRAESADVQRKSGSGIKESIRTSVDELSKEVAYIMDDQPLKCLSPVEEQQIHQAIYERSKLIDEELTKMSKDLLFTQAKTGFQKRQLGGLHVHETTVDVLEVYCDPQSQLVHQTNSRSGKAIRFTRDDGDLGTEEGVQKLWTWIYAYESKHIWVAPECRLWGKFSRFNMGRSTQLFDKTHHQREADRHHLKLCNDMCLHQVSHNRHFHLEQPYGSEMMAQPELMDTKLGTLPATFDMCHVGGLQLPHHDGFLQKPTQVFTTSRHLFELLNYQFCKKFPSKVKPKLRVNGFKSPVMPGHIQQVLHGK